MQKIKLVITLLIVNLLIGLFMAHTANAATIVQIQSLPGYINYTDFKLSCTTDGATAQFYSKKDGGSYTAFGPTISSSTPCQVQVTGTQFGSEGKFWFKVVVDGMESEISTTLDTTAPSAASDFQKVRMNGDTKYHLTWKNPLDSDFARVFIYRGTEAGFEANDSHKVADISGNPGDSQSWDDSGLDPVKQYFYIVRALDKAGNSSSLAGDAGVTTTSTTTQGTPPSGEGKVTVLPKEQGTGSVLGTEVSPSPQASTTDTGYTYPTQAAQGGLFNWIAGHKKISIGIAVVLALLGYAGYSLSKKKS